LETQTYLLRCGVLALPFAPLDSTQSESWGTCNSSRLTFSARPECNVRFDDGQFVLLQITMWISANGETVPGRNLRLNSGRDLRPRAISRRWTPWAKRCQPKRWRWRTRQSSTVQASRH